MKISRKLQQHFEAKIRHAIATGPLPEVRSSTNGTDTRHETPKVDDQDKAQEK